MKLTDKTVKETTNSRVYKMTVRKKILKCNFCPPNKGCNKNWGYSKSWKKCKKKTQW